MSLSLSKRMAGAIAVIMDKQHGVSQPTNNPLRRVDVNGKVYYTFDDFNHVMVAENVAWAFCTDVTYAKWAEFGYFYLQAGGFMRTDKFQILAGFIELAVDKRVSTEAQQSVCLEFAAARRGLHSWKLLNIDKAWLQEAEGVEVPANLPVVWTPPLE